jgi:lysozyme
VPKTNAAGLALIEKFEGCVLYAYDDGDGKWPHPPIEPGDPVVGTLTIGYGHTQNVYPGQTITQGEAQAYLQQDLQEAESVVSELVEVALTPNQFSALVSFVYNEGEGTFESSSLLALVNEKKFADAADVFGEYIYAYGQVEQGLVDRRAAEKALFLAPG